jgi:hypothetical protein
MIMRTRLTAPRLWALQNALTMSLAGPIESNIPNRKDYELALRWVNEELASRSRRSQRIVDRKQRL